MTKQKTLALVVDGRVDVAALAGYAGEVRALVESMSGQLAAVSVTLGSVERDTPDDGDVSVAVKSSLRRLAAAANEAGRALTAVSAPAADLGRDAL